MIIRGGLVFNEDKTFSRRALFIENGIFVSSEEDVSDRTVVDADGLRVIPGLIDIHSHGAAGYDFSDDDAAGLQEILRYEYACGVTSYCPTSMTLPGERLLRLFSYAGETAGNGQPVGAGRNLFSHAGETTEDRQPATTAGTARIVGFNMEGPFLAPSKKGAQKGEYIQPPDVDLFRMCNAACGNRIRLVTVAPEQEGAMEFIRCLRDETVISLGHTEADHRTAREALEAGASHVTHLFNAMQPFLHREPGLAGAAADCESCMVELIADGVHVHESVVRAAFRLFPDRVVLVSDSMRATGMPDGQYELGGQQVAVKGNRAVLADGTIAGSVTNLYDCMRNAVVFGVPIEEAVAAATGNPAKSIGIYDEVGSITVGKRADLLLVDDALRLVRVL